jgi:glycosyltransferase involved in cell wall biosynthesis
MQERKLKLVVAIPAYNEEKNIAKVLVQAEEYTDNIIVCDDGSTDMTAEIAGSLGASVICHSRNKGYGAALATLFARARLEDADIMVTLDGDGQHDPADIEKVLGPLVKGEADIVVGSRFLDGTTKMPGYRKAGIQAITKVSGAIAYNGLTDAQSGFRAYNKKALDTLVPSEMGMGASTEILAKAHYSGLKVIEVPIRVAYSVDSSKRNPAYQGLDVTLSLVKHLSIRHPLMFYGIPGLASLLIAAGSWYMTLSIFETRGTIFTNVALVAVAATVVGLVLVGIAVMLWVLISVIREQ